MSWTTTPVPPERKTGPGWSTTATAPQTKNVGGWFALLEKVAALHGGGDLATVVAPRYTTKADHRAEGSLSARLAPRHYRAATLSGRGLPTGGLYETRPVPAAFTGSGQYGASSINDGLSGVIQVGYAARFSGGGAMLADVVGGRELIDGLSADVIGRYLIPAHFASEGQLVAYFGELSVALAGLIGSGALTGGVKQIYPLMTQLAGNGTLSAPAYAAYKTLANLLGTGQLSAPAFARYLSSLGVSGAGALTALLLASYASTSTAGGTGTVTALVSQRYTLAANLSGGGTLSADALHALMTQLAGNGTLDADIVRGASAMATLLGTGTISATAFAQYLTSLGVSGAGALTALLLAAYQRPTGAGGTGTVTASAFARYGTAPMLSGVGALTASAVKAVPPVIVPDTGAGGGVRGTGTTTSLVFSWSHTVAADANLAIVGVAFRNGTGTATLSATFGGVPMTSCGEGIIGGAVNPTSKVAIFKLKNPPTGTQTVTATETLDVANSARIFQGWSHTYKNADADNVSAAATIGGNGLSNPMTVTTPVPVPVGGYGFYVYANAPSSSGSFTGFDGTQLYANASGSPYLFVLVGHKQGAGAALSATATHNMGSGFYGAIGVGIPPLP